MVVLSRAAGLPARLVSGYSSGAYDAPNARYVITANNAHSWVEIYFTGLGWVEFEPTAGLPAIERNQEQASLPLTVPEPKPVQRTSMIEMLSKVSWRLWISGMVSLVILIGNIWLIMDYYRLRSLASQVTLSILYQRLQRLSGSIVPDASPGDTPTEYVCRLQAKISNTGHPQLPRRLLLPVHKDLNQFIRLYNQGVYSPYPLHPVQQNQAIHIWMRLRWRLTVANLYHWA
jgi:hypothetical protein